MLEDRTKVVLIRPPYSYEIYKSTYKNRYKVANKWVSAPLPIMYFGAAVLDVGADVRMIDGETDHLGCTSSGSSGLDGAGCSVTNFEEGHDTGGDSSSRKRFLSSTKIGKI